MTNKNSSGDSVGADVSKQQSSYSKLLSDKPGTILSLEHETQSTFIQLQHLYKHVTKGRWLYPSF